MKLQKWFACVLLLALLVASLAGCTGKVDPADLLEFPGTHWNDTPEEVRQSLGISEEQIYEDKHYDAGQGDKLHDEWNLVITGLNCFGDEAAYTIFRFTKNDKDVENYGLYYVEIFYPDGTDMIAVQEELKKLYGPGSAEPPSNYYLENDEVTETERKSKGGRYWVAQKNGLQGLPQSVIDNVVDFFAQNQDNPAGEGTVKEFLEKEPLVRMTWGGSDLPTWEEHGIGNRVFFYGAMYVYWMQLFGA